MDHRNRVLNGLFPAFIALSVATAIGAQPPEDETEVPQIDSPAVLAILETEPTTPAECARAAKILVQLERPDLGRQFLQRVIDAKLGEDELAALADQFGSAMFINLAAREELLPEAKTVADAVLAAANQVVQKRVPQFIAQLQDPSFDVRRGALENLKNARAAAIGPMVAVLADPGRVAEHGRILAALVAMRREAVGPLISLLERSDPRLMVQAIRALGAMEAKESVIYLLGPYTSDASDPAIRSAAAAAIERIVGHLPSKHQAIRLLRDRARAYFDGSLPVRAEADGQVTLWRWDDGAKQCTWRKYPPEDAALVLAARLARDAFALAKDDPGIRLLYLATMLEEAAYQTGLDQPLQTGEGTAVDEATSFGPKVIEDVLKYAVDGGHTAAATAAAQILGRSGETDLLLRRTQTPSPLVLAVRHPDRRLRTAAVGAVLQLQPKGPFPGSSYVPEALAFSAASTGTRRALVACTTTEYARQIAGMLTAQGFDVDTATAGRELVQLAIASPDYELALIDAAIEGPTADILLQQLRHDYRAAQLRVGLIARDGYLERARHVARPDSMALAFSRPHDDQSIAWQVEQLQALGVRTFVAHAERQRQAVEALQRLAEIAGSDRRLYDVYRWQQAPLGALYAPKLSAHAAAVLEHLGTPESQRALADLASRWTQPLPTRAAALAAFRGNTRRYGILLTTEEIRGQYDRYNQSADLDQKTQQILGAILDCIEAPTQTLPVVKKGTAEPEVEPPEEPAAN